MKHTETFSISANQPIDPKLIKKIVFAFAEQNIELDFLDVNIHCLLKCRKLFLEQGISQMITSLDNRVTEEVLHKTKNKSLLTKILAEKLQNLSPKQSLVIIDRYIFSKTKDEKQYLDALADIIGPIINNINSLTFITKRNKCDSALYQKTEKLIKRLNSEITPIIKWSDDFHDRFWIADEERGLFVGTSLGGIGIRY